ncbi:probable receptor-like protein kinase At5g59700 isoform X2 [Helianthus annuus]|uniref:probable receptor-like protein kinase At5g59700 isoform X2 n=1 Tax=Helianthus annuus TaxID=4232 RepID=UPI001652DE59|nr:probable receptor-like protein kinase At5g59700 isoform X2 [Helianthus annuus]
MLRLKKSKHLKKVSLAEIREATQSFASENCIGKGGYGMVYKGYLSIAPDSRTSILVAIKRLNEKQGRQGSPEFLTEIHLLSGKKHPNLINLFGYCVEHNEKILIYEYAERGSLDMFLKDDNRTHNLTWLERLKICVGAARGLHYLHNHVGKHEAIIHRDIKSANILIDENWVAKVSDFGLSTLLAGSDRDEVVSQACGTLGYVEPEYAKTDIVTKESDVYSFGIVLFEVLCGRLCTRIKINGGFLSPPSSAKDYYLNNSLDEIVDPSLREAMNFNSMDTFVEIAKECLHDDREERPPMGRVVEELEKSFNLQIRSEKVKIIFQHFDLNKDGGLNKEELGALIVATNSGLKRSTDDRVYHMVRSDQEKGLTCEGLLQIYDNCDVDLDMDYEVLSLKVNLHNGKKPSFTAWERRTRCFNLKQPTLTEHQVGKLAKTVSILDPFYSLPFWDATCIIYKLILKLF